jgi:hypothetical protein
VTLGVVFGETGMSPGSLQKWLEDPKHILELSVVEMQKWLDDPKHVLKLVKSEPRKAIDTGREFYRGWFDLPFNKNKEWVSGRRGEVGDIDVIVNLQIRGDRMPPSLDNKYIIPGPHGTYIQVKLSPALLICNKDPDILVYKILTTKSHPDGDTPYWRRRLKEDFVRMRLVPNEKNSREHDCFSTLCWTGTSDT